MISAVPRALPALAVTDATPSATPRTTPAPSTVATAESLDDQVNATPSTGCAFSSTASATSRSVSPVSNVSVAGATTTMATACATLTVAVLDAGPAVAAMEGGPVGDCGHEPRLVDGCYGSVVARPGHGGRRHLLAVLIERPRQ